MNIYFYNPRWLNPEWFPLFMEILKVGEIINAMPFSERPSILIEQYKKLCHFDWKGEKDENLYVKVTNQILKRISIPVHEKGKWTGCCEVKDIYTDSKHNNPIRNIINCNDENILVFCEDIIISRIPKYCFNTLRKYGGDSRYEGRLCFYLIGEFLRKDKIYLRVRKYPEWVDATFSDKKGNAYYPIIAYLNKKSKELKPAERGSLTTLQFFLSEEGHCVYLKKREEEIKRKEEERKRWEEEAKMREYESYNDIGQEEVNYMLENGWDND